MNQHTHSLSIIIPVYNEESTLPVILKKIEIISRGDDYQILFTADHAKSRIIQKISKITGVKITKIGKIISGKNRSKIVNEKDKQIEAKNKGYIHQF